MNAVQKPSVTEAYGRIGASLVAARAQGLGVAEVVLCEQATPETIGATVKRTLADQEMGRRAAKHSARLRALDPPAQAAARLESLLV